VAPSGRLDRKAELARLRGIGKKRLVAFRDRSAPFDPAIQPGQLRREHRRLDGVETEIAADAVVVVRRRRAVHTQASHEGGQRIVVGRHGPGVARGSQVFRRVEGKRRHRREGARGLPAIRRADRLAGVLEHRNPARGRDLEDGAHVRALTVEVHRLDRLRL
jgi:hypothetical protein